MNGSPHIIPLRDEAIHALSARCWCNPARKLALHDDGQVCGVMVVHRALDCREVVEELTGRSMAGRRWETVVPGSVGQKANRTGG